MLFPIYIIEQRIVPGLVISLLLAVFPLLLCREGDVGWRVPWYLTTIRYHRLGKYCVYLQTLRKEDLLVWNRLAKSEDVERALLV